MREELINLSSEISNKFCSSKSYKEYLRLRELIQKDTVLKEKINQYKVEQMAYQSKVMANQETFFEEEKRISKLYTELFMNETTRDFLIVEKELLDTLNHIYDNIGKDIDISITL